jgi:hypothetical protein
MLATTVEAPTRKPRAAKVAAAPTAPKPEKAARKPRASKVTADTETIETAPATETPVQAPVEDLPEPEAIAAAAKTRKPRASKSIGGEAVVKSTEPKTIEKTAKAPKLAKAAPPAPKPDRVEQNGVRLRTPGSAGGQAWAIFNSQAKAVKGADRVALADVIASTGAKGLLDSNVRAEFYAWRKFHGVSGRTVKPAPAKAPRAAKAPKATPAE